jgi:hypothetical protein
MVTGHRAGYRVSYQDWPPGAFPCSSSACQTSAGGLAQRAQNRIAHAVPVALAEDIASGKLAVFPQRQRRRQLVVINDEAAVQQRVDARYPHHLRLRARQQRPRQPRLALREVGVDIPP